MLTRVAAAAAARTARAALPASSRGNFLCVLFLRRGARAALPHPR
jgi:hypothetical protein